MKQKLIKKLQSKVKLLSVNSLGSVYPEDIINWLETSEKEAKMFIEFLHEQRIISYKYRLKCDCGETCTIYEMRLIRDNAAFCEVCGHEFSVNEILDKAEIVYEIDKIELLEMEEESVDFKVLPNVKGKVVSISTKQEEKQMEIFIGSSSEASDYMDEIAVKLEELGTTPLLWNASGKGIFVPGTNTIDALIQITKRVQAAVFIFNADDKIWNDKSSLTVSSKVRDNVLLEYGLFMGTLGKEKVCFVCKGHPGIATDLKGITYIDGDAGDAQVKMKLKDWINSL